MHDSDTYCLLTHLALIIMRVTCSANVHNTMCNSVPEVRAADTSHHNHLPLMSSHRCRHCRHHRGVVAAAIVVVSVVIVVDNNNDNNENNNVVIVVTSLLASWLITWKSMPLSCHCHAIDSDMQTYHLVFMVTMTICRLVVK